MKEKIYVVKSTLTNKITGRTIRRYCGVFNDLDSASRRVLRACNNVRLTLTSDYDDKENYTIENYEPRHETVWRGYGIEQRWYIDEIGLEGEA